MTHELKTAGSGAKINTEDLTLLSMTDGLGTEYICDGVPASAGVYFVGRGESATPWEIDPFRLLHAVRVLEANETVFEGKAFCEEGSFTVKFSSGEKGLACAYTFSALPDMLEPAILFHLNSFLRHYKATDCELLLPREETFLRSGETLTGKQCAFRDFNEEIALPALSREFSCRLTSRVSGRGVQLALSDMRSVRFWVRGKAVWLSMTPCVDDPEARPTITIKPV